MKRYTIYANSTAWRLRGAITIMSDDSWEPFVTGKTVTYEEFERIRIPNDEYRYFMLPASGKPWSLLKVHHSLVKETDTVADLIEKYTNHPTLIDDKMRDLLTKGNRDLAAKPTLDMTKQVWEKIFTKLMSPDRYPSVYQP